VNVLSFEILRFYDRVDPPNEVLEMMTAKTVIVFLLNLQFRNLTPVVLLLARFSPLQHKGLFAFPPSSLSDPLFLSHPPSKPLVKVDGVLLLSGKIALILLRL
jgi:hypothetical protein